VEPPIGAPAVDAVREWLRELGRDWDLNGEPLTDEGLASLLAGAVWSGRAYMVGRAAGQGDAKGRSRKPPGPQRLERLRVFRLMLDDYEHGKDWRHEPITQNEIWTRFNCHHLTFERAKADLAQYLAQIPSED
jgi:hypothetical protein